ncbi:MAG: glycosyl hydrolase-related protein, partial [Candidatus Ratteibacteria bacterium]
VIIYKGEERIEFDIEIDWKGEENAFVLFSNPLNFFDGKIYGDIPFGIEEKDIEDQPYGRLQGRGWDNIERLIEGMFFAKSFVDYTDGEKTISLIVHNGDRYFIWDKEKKILSHITLRSFKRPNNWEKDINEKIEAKELHRFNYSILFQKDKPETYKTSEILRNNPFVIQRFLKIKNKILDKTNSFIEIKPEDVILTALYREGESFILRLYEPEGKGKEVEIRFNFDINSVAITDICGGKIDKEFQLNGNKIKLNLSRCEIITLSIK